MTTQVGKSVIVMSTEPSLEVLSIEKLLHEEYGRWSEANSGQIKLISQIVKDGQISLEFAVGPNGTFTLVCPSDYPNHEDSFFIEKSSVHGTWCVALNEYIVDSDCCPSLKTVLDKALRLYLQDEQSSMCSTSDDSAEDDEIPMEEDDAYDADIIIDEKKKRWRKKEEYLRKINTKPSVYDIFQGCIKDNPEQIFSSSAASGILTNDLITIMMSAKESGISAEPVDDNIYQWHVYLSSFPPGGPMAEDLNQIKKEFGYQHIQLQLDFTMDLYPFYPPVVKVVRPRLEGTTINSVATMDLLKLSNWNPARDMKSVLEEIKDYLDKNSRLNTKTKRNDIARFPEGAYLEIENHLMRLTYVSEIPISSAKSIDHICSPFKDDTSINVLTNGKKKHFKKVWFPRGTGYSSATQSGWDVQAYLAAQKEKDHQIELVLTDILKEITKICGITTIDFSQKVPDHSHNSFSDIDSCAWTKSDNSWTKFHEFCLHANEAWDKFTATCSVVQSSSTEAGSSSTSSENSSSDSVETHIEKLQAAFELTGTGFDSPQFGIEKPHTAVFPKQPYFIDNPHLDFEDKFLSMGAEYISVRQPETSNRQPISYVGQSFVGSDISKLSFEKQTTRFGKPYMVFEKQITHVEDTLVDIKKTDINDIPEVFEDPLPLFQNSLPLAKKPLPLAKKPLPLAEKPLQLAEKPLPLAEKSLPVVETLNKVSKACAGTSEVNAGISYKDIEISKTDTSQRYTQMQFSDVEMSSEKTDTPEVLDFSSDLPEDEKSEHDSIGELCNVLLNSTLIPFLESKLKVTSFLEICQHTPVYKRVVQIISAIASQPKLVPLLWHLPGRVHSLYDLLSPLEKEAESIVTKLKKAETNTPNYEKWGGRKFTCTDLREIRTPLIFTPSSEKESAEELFQESKMRAASDHTFASEFYRMIQTVKSALQGCGFLGNMVTPSGEGETTGGRRYGINSLDTSRTYKDALKDLQFISCDIEVEGPRAHMFSSQFRKALAPSSQQVVRIAQEMGALSTSLPLDIGSSIFVRTDDSKFTLLKALITGPEGTPYTGGCFIFDIFLPSQYPHVPPHVKLCTTGGGTVRFNPNLYACGRVCLSLLGTWHGLQGEAWLPTSTLLQVLVSIQSLILVPEPFFNEPGYESMINTPKGKTESANYNYSLMINTIRYAMLEQIRHPAHGFEEVIRRHFIFKKNRILKEIKDYMRKHRSAKELTDAYYILKKELEKLVRAAKPE